LVLEAVNSYGRDDVESLFINKTFVFSVIKSSSIIGLEYPSGQEIINYPRREIPLPSQPFHLHVSCDQSCLVVAIKKDNCAHALIYSLPSFAAKVSNVHNNSFISYRESLNSYFESHIEGICGI
jgi:hypothetical protein